MSGSNDEISNKGGPGSSAEPSMEEILASIRRILKDDQADGQSSEAEEEDVLVLDSTMVVRPSSDPVPIDASLVLPESMPDFTDLSVRPPAQEENVLPPAADEGELEQPHLASELAEPEFPAEDRSTEPFDFPAADVGLPEPETTLPEATTSLGDTAMPNDPEENFQPPPGLTSEAASNAAAGSIGSLIRSISSERQVAIGRPGLTLEDLVREELRPLLKSWLDSNLPPLVERIVRAEIERVVERAGL